MEEQLSLLEGVPRERQAVSEEQVKVQGSPISAIRLSILSAGLDPKELYLPLGIDKATWSKIMDGHPKFSFPINKIENLLDLTKNDIPLVWLTYRRGYRLVPLQTEQEKRIGELEAANAELRKEIETLAKYGIIQRARTP